MLAIFLWTLLCFRELFSIVNFLTLLGLETTRAGRRSYDAKTNLPVDRRCYAVS